MTITVDDEVVEHGQTVDDLVLESLNEALFQIDTITVI